MKHEADVSFGPKAVKSDLDQRTQRPFSTLEWAWEFLRRNETYRRDFRFFKRSPSCLSQVLLDPTNPKFKKFSTRWFELDPPALSGEKLGDWVDRNLSLTKKRSPKKRTMSFESVSWSGLNRLDASRYWLTSWLDPEKELPGIVEDHFYLNRLEVETDSAMNLLSMGHIQSLIRNGPAPIDFQQLLSLTAYSPTEVALKFDLRLPIPAQIHMAELQLYSLIDNVCAKTPAEWHLINRKALRNSQSDPRYAMLNILDARSKVKSDMAAFRLIERNPKLHSTDECVKTYESNLREAERYRDGGYIKFIYLGLTDVLAKKAKAARDR